MMRTTVMIDDELLKKAAALAPTGLSKSDLIRECMKAFIQQQSARRLAALGGQGSVQLAHRRRDESIS